MTGASSPQPPARRTLATRLYLRAARAIAAILAHSEIVETIFVRRSVASGEVDFGRSDIDLSIVIRRDASGAALCSLANSYRALRLPFPMLGQAQVYDGLDLRTWWHTDPYRARIDGQAGIVLHGPPVTIPRLPIRPDQAAWRAIFWLDGYIPRAFRLGNGRNLRKLAIEMWNAYATASGLASEPFVRRCDALRAWSVQPGFPDGAMRNGGRRRLLSVCFEVAAQLHRLLLPPLQPPRHPLIWRVQLPPTWAETVLVVVPRPDAELPPEALRPNALLLTPEALHLYVEYVNPFAGWILPPSVRDSGIAHPSREAFARACRNYGASFRTRSPGFEDKAPLAAVGRAFTSRYTATALAAGQTPVPATIQQLGFERELTHSLSRYYWEIYTPLRRVIDETWEKLYASGRRFSPDGSISSPIRRRQSAAIARSSSHFRSAETSRIRSVVSSGS